MARTWIILSVLLMGVAMPSRAETIVEGAHRIRQLAAPALAGRGAGTLEERQAAHLIATWLSELDQIQPAFDGQWLQAFPLSGAAGDSSVNVAGILAGRGELASRWIIIGAHLDHLGRIDPEAGGIPAPGEYYPGAGDNASGVVAVLDVGRQLADDRSDTPRRSLLICSFGAEEIGLLGSAHLSRNLPVDASMVDAMVNLDAVGRLVGGSLHVAGLETCALFAESVDKAAAGQAIKLQDASLLRSDHASFIDVGIPALFFFTGAYPEMNAPADSLPAIDLSGLERVARITSTLVHDLLREPGPLNFVPLPDPGPATSAGNRQTWFGSVPDFEGAEVVGYVIGGVVAKGPAATAGLLAGDVLVKLAGQPVTDLATFTTAMRQHDPGDVIEIVAEREGRSLRFLVTLGDRSQRPN